MLLLALKIIENWLGVIARWYGDKPKAMHKLQALQPVVCVSEMSSSFGAFVTSW
jgi:hypothetical protein